MVYFIQVKPESVQTGHWGGFQKLTQFSTLCGLLQIESQRDNVVSLSVNSAKSRSLECCSILALMPAEVNAMSVAGQDLGAHVCQAGPIPALSGTSLEILMAIP